MKTEFRKLAERIDDDINGIFYLCTDLTTNKATYLENYFKPTQKEADEYNVGDIDCVYSAWLSEKYTTRDQDNSFRILILLFAEQHYLTYNK